MSPENRGATGEPNGRRRSPIPRKSSRPEGSSKCWFQLRPGPKPAGWTGISSLKGRMSKMKGSEISTRAGGETFPFSAGASRRRKAEGWKNSAQLYGGADVFSSVDSIASRPDNFRHIRPHVVKAGPGKGASISSAGNRNLSALGLALVGKDNFRCPVIIPHGPVFRVGALGEDPGVAFLDAAEAIFAQEIGSVDHLPVIINALLVNQIGAIFFDALRAIQTSIPFDDAERDSEERIARLRVWGLSGISWAWPWNSPN